MIVSGRLRSDWKMVSSDAKAACERLRSKPMWTLTHPKNRPCGYAVDMLRTTSHETLLKGKGAGSGPRSRR